MFDIQRFTAPPPFGLMSAADKAAIDNFPNTYLKIDDASNTYVTKTGAICGVVESDSGVAFLNGAGAVVFTMPIYGKKKSPQLSISPATVEATGGKRKTASASITRLGDGVVSKISDTADAGSGYSFSLDGLNLEFTTDGSPGTGTGDYETVTCTIAVAETDEYATATAVWTVTLTT